LVREDIIYVVDGELTHTQARLWGAIGSQHVKFMVQNNTETSLTENRRFLTCSGQECARLDRLQIVAPQEDVQHHLSELHGVFANDQVFVDQWQTFMAASFQGGAQQWFGYALSVAL